MSQTKVQLIKDGALAEDSIVHDGDTNTKIRFSGTDTVSVETAGSERLVVQSDGDIGLATTTPNLVGYTAPTVSIGKSGNAYSVVELQGTQASNGAVGVITGYNTSGSSRIATINWNRDGANNSGSLSFETASSGTLGERMRISKEGYITKPNHPSFCARHDDNSTFSGNIIVLTRISNSWDVWNIGGHYSTSTGKFTVPVAGVYYFEGQLMTTGHSNGDNIQDMFSLESNRGRITYVRQRESYFSTSTNANGYYTNSLGSPAQLAAGDTVWLQRQSGHSWGYSNRYYSYFTGWLIG